MEYLLEIDSYDNIKNLLDKLKIVNIDVDINNVIRFFIYLQSILITIRNYKFSVRIKSLKQYFK